MTLRKIIAISLCLGAGLVVGCASRWRSVPVTTGEKKAPASDRTAKPPRSDPRELDRKAQAQAHYAAGVAHGLNDRPDDARSEFTKAAALDPAHERLVIDLAHNYLQAQKPDQAVSVLQPSAQRQEATALLHAWLGLALAQAGKTEEAIHADRAAIKRDPDLLLGYLNLAQVHFQQKRPDEALKVLDQAGKRSTVGPPFLVDLAEGYLMASRRQQVKLEQIKTRVVALLDRAAKAKPGEPLVLDKLADGYKHVGEFAKAGQIYRVLLDLYGQGNAVVEPLLREQLFQLYLRDGDNEKAAEQLKELLRRNPTNAKVHYWLGVLAAENKQLAEAADYFEKALLLDADFDSAYYDLAGVQVALEKPEAALKTLDKARTKFRRSFALEFYTGVAQAALKRYSEAVRSYTDAEVIAKTSEPSRLTHLFYFQLGAAFERNGNYAEAERQFRRSLELSPDYSETMNYLGYMWAERGTNLVEALTLIQKAVKLEPKNAAYLDSLAWVLFKLKRVADALPPLQEAIQLSEKPDATLFDHLGDIQAAMGQTDAAREAWRRALELEPNDAIRRKLEASSASSPPR